MSDDTHIAGLDEFNKYGDLFQDLTKRIHINTFHMDVIEMAVSYDSKLAMSIVKKDELYFELQAFNLENHEVEFRTPFTGEFVRMNIIE